MSEAYIAVMMGSESDLPVMESALEVLKGLGIKTEVRVLSAHRTPEETRDYVRDADRRGCAVFIAAAGLAAHLAGAVAAVTVKPVIGVPMAGGPLSGFDALLSTVQMPGGVPVACVAIGKAGARNAGYLAAEIVALCDGRVAERLRAERAAMADRIRRKNAEISERYDHGGD